jgi:hypothetical protein
MRFRQGRDGAARARAMGVLLSVAAVCGFAGCGSSTSSAPATVTQTVTSQSTAPPSDTSSSDTGTSSSSDTGNAGTGNGGGGGSQTVPSDLVDKNLVDAESELDSMGIQYTHQANSGEEVILRSNWGVCSTTPSAGQPVSGAVVLHVGHFSCGA